jgi:hypothetical protein
VTCCRRLAAHAFHTRGALCIDGTHEFDVCSRVLSVRVFFLVGPSSDATRLRLEFCLVAGRSGALGRWLVHSFIAPSSAASAAASRTYSDHTL